ncbi:DUF885 family protein [Marinimicrobium sp. ABcell2]|uniref:DUF885 domain-containing protein n=1 Tax=Marinimicrobium sp. ABcell2 TaxID=3069751 RepID=UPI0027B786DC|nr:DUF885 domain-containing protein [Marinimicrobium sp. ABcell2]MDQ2076463.1 DUF885 domain-containing protein [Marinimicrobium sp. ABcell2]
MFLKIQRYTLLALTLIFAASQAHAKDAEARELFEQFFEEQVALSPMYQTYLGRKTQYDQWDDISPAQDQRAQQLRIDQLDRLRQLDVAQLNPDNQLSYRLFEYQLQRGIDAYQWRDHNYPVNQMFGLHARIPSFLMNNHRIDTPEDARAYITRLQSVAPLMQQLIANLERRAEKGILAPNFVYPYVIDDSRNIISGAPFQQDAEDSPLLADIRAKLANLDLTDEARDQLLTEAKSALKDSVQPGYQALISALEDLEKQADDKAGAWKLPEGDAYYANALERMTTTEMSAKEIHELGVAEVKRIQQEMRGLKKEVGFEGDLHDFFRYLREHPKFYFPDTEAGREAFLQQTQELIDAMEERLPELFGRLPKADLIVRPVEAFRAQSAGKAFYQGPAQDGSRPGIYYINLYDMQNLPKYQMEALTYHEALPGHHMQIAIAQEMDNLPSFRRHSSYTAYSEGWGLYAELIPKELGFYEDPYSDFGRLGMELWRAVRLVVDTGIHAKRWTREQAIDYFVGQTPMGRPDAVREVERYIVMPAQATSYKVGMNKILELRAYAQESLGEQFDVRAFHDLVLGGGAVPLTILEEEVHAWVAQQESLQDSP